MFDDEAQPAACGSTDELYPKVDDEAPASFPDPFPEEYDDTGFMGVGPDGSPQPPSQPSPSPAQQVAPQAETSSGPTATDVSDYPAQEKKEGSRRVTRGRTRATGHKLDFTAKDLVDPDSDVDEGNSNRNSFEFRSEFCTILT